MARERMLTGHAFRSHHEANINQCWLFEERRLFRWNREVMANAFDAFSFAWREFIG